MEEFNQYNDQNPQNFPPLQRDVEGSVESMILGIVGLVVTFFFSCFPVGIVLSIMAFRKGKRAEGIYYQNYKEYRASSYTQAKAGRVLGITGIAISCCYALMLILFGLFMLIMYFINPEAYN